MWATWRLVEASQRQHGDTRRALAADVAPERCAATLWLLQAAQEFCRCDRTAHLASAILDLYVRRRAPLRPPGEQSWRAWLEEHAVAALLLACKFQEVDIHMVEEFVLFCGERHESGAVLRAELDVCNALRMHLAIPTRLDFLFWTMQRLRWPTMYTTHRGLHERAAMLAHLLVDVSLLCEPCAAHPASLVSSAAFCLALAILRCGRWSGGAPGPASAAEQYWAPSMQQATGTSAEELRPVLRHLQAEHEAVFAEMAEPARGGGGGGGGGGGVGGGGGGGGGGAAAAAAAAAEAQPPGDDADGDADGNADGDGGVSPGKAAVLLQKCSHPRFMKVHLLRPFSPHAGGSVSLPSGPRTPGDHSAFG